MPLDTFIALLTFAFVASVTPGPNNLMLLASGVNFGYLRTIPHMIGIVGGFGFLQVCIGFGLGALLMAFPQIHTALRVLGGAYLLYLSWRIASSSGVGHGKVGARPLTIWAAAAFQWVNPKGWMMSVTAMSLYTSPQAPNASVLLVAGTFALLTVFSVSIWAGFGTAMRRLLADPKKLRWFNIVMGLLLALTTIPMVL